jgi:hypothetical protein
MSAITRFLVFTPIDFPAIFHLLELTSETGQLKQIALFHCTAMRNRIQAGRGVSNEFEMWTESQKNKSGDSVS